MYSKIFTILFLVLITPLSFSQTIEEIKNSKQFIYGIGEASVYERADKLALNDLLSQISVSVSSKFEFIQKDSNLIYTEYAKSIIETYSSVTLTNTLRKEVVNNGIYTVIRYLNRSNVQEIFNKRKESIYNYIEAGINSEKNYQIGDALRNYYWAYILLSSHPDYNSIKYLIHNESALLKVFLPNKINEIFSNTDIEVSEKFYNQEEKHAVFTLHLIYKGKPIQNLDYSFRNEYSWSGTVNANNGIGYVDYYNDYSKNIKDIRLRIEYIYFNKSYFDKEVQSVLNSEIDIPYFSSSEKQISLNRIKDNKSNSNFKLTTLNEVEEQTFNIIRNNLDVTLENIRTKSVDIDRNLFTKGGFEAYTGLIEYGNGFILSESANLKMIIVNDEVIVRSIPMKFSFSRNQSFTEEVIFIFNKEGLLNDINFSLSQISIDDILSKEERFASTEDKFFIIRFLETYKTAYCLKRISYLEKVFADDALIIVGRVLEKPSFVENPIAINFNQETIEYLRITKREYISRLSRVFQSNEYVNIHFEDCTVKKAKKDINIFGIQIAQDYTSASYADKGYLFLLLDLRDTLNPIIHVRTWQPKKNEDGSIYGLDDFPFQTH